MTPLVRSVNVGIARASVTIELAFRALTSEKTLLPRLLAAGDDLGEDVREQALRRRRAAGDD
jgi:hypothetical protein